MNTSNHCIIRRRRVEQEEQRGVIRPINDRADYYVAVRFKGATRTMAPDVQTGILDMLLSLCIPSYCSSALFGKLIARMIERLMTASGTTSHSHLTTICEPKIEEISPL